VILWLQWETRSAGDLQFVNNKSKTTVQTPHEQNPELANVVPSACLELKWSEHQASLELSLLNLYVATTQPLTPHFRVEHEPKIVRRQCTKR